MNKHGLSSGSRVLSNENQQEFDDLIADYHRTFTPTNIFEKFLVEEMAQASWRLARFRRLEGVLIEQMAGAGNPDAVLTAALLDSTAGALKTLQRLAAAAERSYYRAYKQLQAVRKQEDQPTEKPELPNEPNFTATRTNGAPKIKPESPESSPAHSLPDDC
jgi:hypothetical protein